MIAVIRPLQLLSLTSILICNPGSCVALGVVLCPCQLFHRSPAGEGNHVPQVSLVKGVWSLHCVGQVSDSKKGAA